MPHASGWNGRKREVLHQCRDRWWYQTYRVEYAILNLWLDEFGVVWICLNWDAS